MPANAPLTKELKTSTSHPTPAIGTSKSETPAQSLSLELIASPPGTPPRTTAQSESGTTPTTTSSDGPAPLVLPMTLALMAVSSCPSADQSQVPMTSQTTASC